MEFAAEGPEFCHLIDRLSSEGAPRIGVVFTAQRWSVEPVTAPGRRKSAGPGSPRSRGTALGCLGEPSTASPTAWAAAGAALRRLHDAPLPDWSGRAGRELDGLVAELDGECEWLVTNDVLPSDLVTRNRRVTEAALRRGLRRSRAATCSSPRCSRGPRNCRSLFF